MTHSNINLKNITSIELMFIAFVGISSDLFSTWIGLTFFHAIELIPYGNNPLLYYSEFLGFVFVLGYLFKKGLKNKSIIIIEKFFISILLIIPYYCFVHNMLGIIGI